MNDDWLSSQPVSGAPVPLSECHRGDTVQVHHLEGPQSNRLREAGFFEDADVSVVNEHVGNNLVCKVNYSNIVISGGLGEQILVVHK
jgi:Fe2+ transport system protein FeoA